MTTPQTQSIQDTNILAVLHTTDLIPFAKFNEDHWVFSDLKEHGSVRVVLRTDADVSKDKVVHLFVAEPGGEVCFNPSDTEALEFLPGFELIYPLPRFN